MGASYLSLVRSVSSLLMILMLYLSVCFLTSLERKVLGYAQNRKGPTKMTFFGSFQPVVDGGKLLSKTFIVEWYFFFNSIVFTTMMGMLAESVYMSFCIENGNFMTYITLASVILVYIISLSGWKSGSVHGTMGGLRSSSQMISYDIVIFFITIMVSLFYWSHGYKMIFSTVFLMDIFSAWTLVATIETNRSPFDFAEGESELISGFNIEYLGALFALLFIGEHGMVIFSSRVSSLLFGYTILLVPFTLMTLMIRGFIPRSRYDSVMMLCWKFILIYLSFLVLKLI